MWLVVAPPVPGRASGVWGDPSGDRLQEWKLLGGCSFLGNCCGAELAGDGRHLAMANANGTVYILDLSKSPAKEGEHRRSPLQHRVKPCKKLAEHRAMAHKVQPPRPLA
jgi:hypothetical protein